MISARAALEFVSIVLGWTYTISWSVSFYPQPILNWKRRSTTGTSVDYPLLNVLGFIAYVVSVSAFLYSPTVRSQYAARHPSAPEPTARFNDWAFGAHALIITAIAYSQYYPKIWRFEVSSSQRVSLPAIAIMVGCTMLVVAVSVLVLLYNPTQPQNALTWAWIDVAYAFGNVKLVLTFCKYAPQAIMNYRQQSTRGWSIGTVLFDVVGGVASLAQLSIDAGLQGDLREIVGNSTKLVLALVSLAFDLIFMIQHYLLYRHSEERETEVESNTPVADTRKDENTPLLGSSSVV